MKNSTILIYFKDSQTLAQSLSLKSGFHSFSLARIDYSFGEFSVLLPDMPKDARIYFVAQNNGEPTELLVRILMTVDTLEQNGYHDINLIIPYFPFSRQDRERQDNRAVASRMISRLFNAMPIKRILSFDLHNSLIKDYFKADLLDLTMLDGFVNYFTNLDLKDVVIVAPDYGRFNAAKYVASAFNNAPYVLIHKERDKSGNVHVTQIEGDVAGKTALIIEDIIDTGNTLVSAVSALIANGVKEIYVAATHGVFSGNALKNIKALGVKKIIVTNTIAQHLYDEVVEVLDIEDVVISNL